MVGTSGTTTTAANRPVAQPPRRAVSGRRLPAMNNDENQNPRPPQPTVTRQRSPRLWASRPTSAPAERTNSGLDGTGAARQPSEPAKVASQPQGAQQPLQRGRRPVSAPQFRRGRAVPGATAQQPDRSSLKTPTDGMNRPKTPTAPSKTPDSQRSDSVLGGVQSDLALRSFPPPSAGVAGLGAATLDFQTAQPDRSDLVTPFDGTNRPDSSLGRNAPMKTPPASAALDHSVLGPMDSHVELPLPFATESSKGVDLDASKSMWEPSPRTMDELDAEIMKVTGAPRDGSSSTSVDPARAPPERTAVTRPSSAPQVPRPSSAKAGRFVQRPKSSLGHTGSMEPCSAVTPRRLAALQQEVRQMKAERINPTPTKSGDARAARIDFSVSASAVGSKPEPSAVSVEKKRPARPAMKTKSLKQPAKLTVQVGSPNEEPGSNETERSTNLNPDDNIGDATPPATIVGDGTPARADWDTSEDTFLSLRSESVADLWAAEDANGIVSHSSTPSSVVPSSNGPIVVVDSKSTADALQDMMRRVDDLTARLTTAEQEKLQLSAKVKVLQDGHGSSPTQVDEQASLVQNQLVDLEMEKQHLEHTTNGLRGLMDSVESTWKEKYCKLAAQSMFRGSALEQLQGKNHTAAATSVENKTCGRCNSMEEDVQNWREKADSLEAELHSTQSSEATARKQMAAAVSSLERLQEEHELTISSLRAQADIDLEKERSTVMKLTDQLRSERKSAADHLDASRKQAESSSVVQRAARTAETELQAEREQRQHLEQQVASMEEQMSQLQFRLAANETELLQNEHERQRSQETLKSTEAELARSSQVSSAATLRIQQLESDLRAARDAANAAAISSASGSPREIARTAAQAGDSIMIQHLKDEAAQLRARLVATEVGAQEVAEEKSMEIMQLRTKLQKLQTSSNGAVELKRKNDIFAQQQQQQHAALAEDVKRSLAMGTQTATDVADHSNKLVELAASVEEIRELMDHGTDTAIDLHEHVGTLQTLVLAQQQESANMRAEHAAAAIADAQHVQLMLSQPPAGAAREAVRAKQSDASHPAFSPLSSPAAEIASENANTQANAGTDVPAKSLALLSSGSTTSDLSEQRGNSTESKSTRERGRADTERQSRRNGQHGLQKRGGNSNRTRDKQESMRNALRQLKRELGKVQDTRISSVQTAAQLRKEGSGGYTLSQTAPQQETATIGGALAAAAAASAATRDRRPAKLSTIDTNTDQTVSQSMLRMR